MSSLKKLAKHSSHYFVGEFLVMAAGLISFPIFARIFTEEEYGILSLLTITFSLCCLFASLGMRPSVVRFYNEFKLKTKSEDMAAFYSTPFFITLMSSFFMFIVILIYSATKFTFLPCSYIILLRVGSSLILIRALFKLMLNFLRAEQKTIMYNSFYVLQQYTTLIFALVLVVTFRMGLFGLITGQIICEAIFTVLLFIIFFRQKKLNIFKISGEYAKEALYYGAPLIVLNFSALLISFGDRFVINWIMGLKNVAIYSVGFKICSYVGVLIQTPLNSAIVPIYMELWEREGKEATEVFISRVANYYLMVSAALIGGFVAVGKELITLIASDKYASSFIVTPYILGATLLSGFVTINAAGMFLLKRTKLYGALILITAMVNVALNLVLVPLTGILGAAVATLLSYSIFFFIIRKVSGKFLKIDINLLKVLKYIIAGLIMFFMLIVTDLNFKNNVLIVLVKILEGAFIYGSIVYMSDLEFRNDLMKLAKGIKLFIKRKSNH